MPKRVAVTEEMLLKVKRHLVACVQEAKEASNVYSLCTAMILLYEYMIAYIVKVYSNSDMLPTFEAAKKVATARGASGKIISLVLLRDDIVHNMWKYDDVQECFVAFVSKGGLIALDSMQDILDVQECIGNLRNRIIELTQIYDLNTRSHRTNSLADHIKQLNTTIV